MTGEHVNPDEHIFHSPAFESVVQEAIKFLLNTPVFQLPPTSKFSGPGVYAIFYTGDFGIYKPIADQNEGEFNQPIYVGKAVPSGWRTARSAENFNKPILANRLREHSRSIEQGEGLELTDFYCRFIILQGVETDLISTVEASLIRKYIPLWNTAVDGFGNHDPGKGRYNQARSEWDVLHPGRSWAERLTGKAPNREGVILKVRQRLSS